MPNWVGLLRGINVGGRNKLKMAELKACLADAGLDDVATYIQSGNLVFRSSSPAGKLGQLIADAIERQWGYFVPTLVLKADQLAEAVAEMPYEDSNPQWLHVTFLHQKPKAKEVKVIEGLDFGDDRFEIDGRIVYLDCPNGYSRTKLNNSFFEKKLNVNATTRNWKTVTKLLAMVTAAD